MSCVCNFNESHLSVISVAIQSSAAFPDSSFFWNSAHILKSAIVLYANMSPLRGVDSKTSIVH